MGNVICNRGRRGEFTVKKMFLSSSFKDVAKYLPEFVGEELKGKTITFIPTAALHEKVNFYVKSGKKALEKLGLIADELHVSTAEQKEIAGKLQNNDCIYISGGNTFFLLQELRKSGADKIIAEQINAGKLYIGESAGSMIVSPCIEYVRDMDDFETASELSDCKALDIVDFYPLPHYTNMPFKKTVEKIISKYENSLTLKPISNSQAILIDNEDITVI